MASDFNSIIKKAMKNWDCPELMTRVKSDVGDKIPFSAPFLNWATYGGIPRYRLIEFFGDAGSGKTSSAIDICKQAISLFEEEHRADVDRYTDLVDSGKKEYKGPLEELIEKGPKKILYVDLENAFDPKWARTLGIKKEYIYDDDSILKIMTPPNIAGEDIANVVLDCIGTDEFGLIVIDSIPSFVPRAELEKKVGERTVSALAGMMTVFIRKVIPMLQKHRCTMIAINQLRDDMDNQWSDGRTPGGRAVKFYSSLRLKFRLGKPVDKFGNELKMSAEQSDGSIVNVNVVKQKTAPHDRKLATYYLMSYTGIRPDFDYGNLGINKYGFVKKSGGWFTMCDPYTGEVIEDENGDVARFQGQVKVYDYLKKHPSYYALVKRFVDEDFNKVEIEDDEQVIDSYTIDVETGSVETNMEDYSLEIE